MYIKLRYVTVQQVTTAAVLKVVSSKSITNVPQTQLQLPESEMRLDSF